MSDEIKTKQLPNGDKITKIRHEEDEFGFSSISEYVHLKNGMTIDMSSNNVTTKPLKGDFYISYVNDETALCIPGEDTIPVMILILKGDYRNEFSKIISENKFPLGECLRFFTHHQKDIKESSFIAGGLDYIEFKLNIK